MLGVMKSLGCREDMCYELMPALALLYEIMTLDKLWSETDKGEAIDVADED